MSKHTKKNPLSYLGWLGLIGIIGVNLSAHGAWILQLFLIYFFFFIYRNVPADELFWFNVKKAGLSSFILGLIINNIVLITLAIFESIGGNQDATKLIIGMFLISSFIPLLFFIGILMYYNRQEKKYVEKDNA